MASVKDASMNLKSELAELEGLDGNLDTTTDVSADLVEMKNRMDKSDQEMRAMTDAMKSTLLDVRTLMQDMDNPFNMLRDMGVDKLVSKAVETVEEEVNKKKNEDAKNKMAGMDEKSPQAPIIARVEGSTSSHPGMMSNQRAPMAPPAVQAPQTSYAPQQVSTPVAAPVASPVNEALNTVGAVPGSVPFNNGGILQPAEPIYGSQNSVEAAYGSTPYNAGGVSHPSSPVNTVQASGEQAHQLISRSEPAGENVVSVASSPVDHVSNAVAPQMAPTTEPQYSYFEERLFRTEETVNNLANTMGELIKTIRTQRASPRVKQSPVFDGTQDSADNYEAYVGLVTDYMYIRLGDQGAEELLLEGMYKEWASPNVVRDIMDKLSGKKQRRGKTVNLEANVEDRMLITTLLRNLDKPTNQWSESTHLFMLMALVSRAKEITS
jgi:hypothetical protein